MAVKAVTINEQFFVGHYPGKTVTPGVLIIEALAQAAGILAMETFGLFGTGRLIYFTALSTRNSIILWFPAFF